MMADAERDSLLRVLQDYKSTHPDPWYAIAKLPAAGIAWDVRTNAQSILTIQSVPVKLFTVGPVTGLCFYSSLTDDAARSRISIKLMRDQDRAALGAMHNRARWGAAAVAAPPLEKFTAIAVHDHDEVGVRRCLGRMLCADGRAGLHQHLRRNVLFPRAGGHEDDRPVETPRGRPGVGGVHRRKDAARRWLEVVVSHRRHISLGRRAEVREIADGTVEPVARACCSVSVVVVVVVDDRRMQA